MTFKIPSKFFGKPIEGALEKILTKPATAPVPSVVNSPTSVTSSGHFWTIDNVPYRGSVYTVDLLKELAHGGVTHTQDEWAEHYKVTKDENGFHAPDYPILYGVFKALRTSKDDPTQSAMVEEARTFLQNTARAKWLMTLSRIKYKPSGLDTVIHNYGTTDQHSTDTDFIGKDEYLKDTSNATPYRVLLQTGESVEEIDKVFQWLNKTGAYLWRVNNKPSAEQDRVAGFDAYSGRAGLGCGGDPQVSNSALGVRLAQKNGMVLSP